MRAECDSNLIGRALSFYKPVGGQETDPAQSAVVAFENEKLLRRLIASSPASLLPNIADGLWAAAEEVQVPRDGPADVVVVDREGAITVVECKRAKNREARRWVVGQLLGYGAWLWKLDYKSFRKRFEERGGDLTKLEELPGFCEAVSNNLEVGRFQLIIAADSINEWLSRTVVFLNHHSAAEIRCLAVSIDPATRKLTGIIGRDTAEAWPYRPSWRGARKRILDGTKNEDDARAVAGLLHWAADQQPLVDIDYNPKAALGRVKAPGCILFRIVKHRDVKVSLTAFGKDEERIGRLRDELTAIDARFAFEDGEKPEAPLEALVCEDKREAFLTLMSRTLASVTRPSRG